MKRIGLILRKNFPYRIRLLAETMSSCASLRPFCRRAGALYGCLLLVFAFCAVEVCFAQSIKVQSIQEFRSVLKTVAAGSTIKIAPGKYSGGVGFANIHGQRDAPIVIGGTDPLNPPVFEGTGEGLKVSSSSYVKFQHIVFRGYQVNGINIDDGGDVGNPSHHIILENIRIEDIGPNGIHNALKMSGVDHFIVRKIHFEGWGGAGIDLVGCHNGVIESSRFLYKEGFRTANSIQIKGGSRSILVQSNLFVNSGTRIVQIGGSTGMMYFRPAVQNYEAKDVIVAGNTFIGGEAQISWVTAQDSYVHHNLFYAPAKYLGRILQESEDKRFFPCQRGIFEKNIIVLSGMMQTIFNIGEDTRPESFVFRGNVWNRIRSDVEGRLPSAEIGGAYGFDPALRKTRSGKLTTVSSNPIIRATGPWAYRPLEFADEFGDIHLANYGSLRLP